MKDVWTSDEPPPPYAAVSAAVTAEIAAAAALNGAAVASAEGAEAAATTTATAEDQEDDTAFCCPVCLSVPEAQVYFMEKTSDKILEIVAYTQCFTDIFLRPVRQHDLREMPRQGN